MTNRLIWDRDGRDWPNREASRFVKAAGLRWHVQVMGSGPTVLLLHGTGASTHSWRALAPILASWFTVVAPDLPGHGFTDTPPGFRLSLPGMAHSVGELLRVLDLRPVLAAGHSAGAAILVRMCVDGTLALGHLVSLNGALLPMRGLPLGLPGEVVSSAVKLLTSTPLFPRLFASYAGDRRTVARLLRDTGSTIDAEGMALYQRLASSPAHVGGALGMMANWNLRSLRAELPRLKTPLVLVVGTNDRTIPPTEATEVQALVPGASIVELAGLGHLAHEEQPQACARLIADLAA
jgi:magnesium chelatase accessory protein